MRSLQSACVAVITAAAATGASAQNVDVGTIALLPDQAGQQVPLFVTGGELIEVVNLVVQIGDGSTGPVIEALNVIDGTIFDGMNEGQFDIQTDPRLFVTTVTTPFTNPPTTVAADGLLATLTIDTTGLSSGGFDLLITGTLAGGTDFGPDLSGTPIPVNITNGSLIVVPEPTAAALLPAAVGWSLRRRRGRQ